MMGALKAIGKVLLCSMVMIGSYVGAAYAIEAVTHYNAYRIHCDSLRGQGEVIIWFEDETYKIPIVCKDGQ